MKSVFSPGTSMSLPSLLFSRSVYIFTISYVSDFGSVGSGRTLLLPALPLSFTPFLLLALHGTLVATVLLFCLLLAPLLHSISSRLPFSYYLLLLPLLPHPFPHSHTPRHTYTSVDAVLVSAMSDYLLYLMYA